jgi:hypothetical protein
MSERDDIDPRLEAEAQIARALQIVIDASDPAIDDPDSCRDYTAEELETLFFALSMAMIQLRKVPGGKEARDRFYEKAKDTLLKRGRDDLVARSMLPPKVNDAVDEIDALLSWAREGDKSSLDAQVVGGYLHRARNYLLK